MKAALDPLLDFGPHVNRYRTRRGSQLALIAKLRLCEDYQIARRDQILKQLSRALALQVSVSAHQLCEPRILEACLMSSSNQAELDEALLCHMQGYELHYGASTLHSHGTARYSSFEKW